jgi:hypothetical protein
MSSVAIAPALRKTIPLNVVEGEATALAVGRALLCVEVLAPVTSRGPFICSAVDGKQKTPARQGTGVSVRPSIQVQCGRNRLGHAFNAVRENWFLCRVGHTGKEGGYRCAPLCRLVPFNFSRATSGTSLRKLIEPEGERRDLLPCRDARTNLGRSARCPRKTLSAYGNCCAALTLRTCATRLSASAWGRKLRRLCTGRSIGDQP